MFNIRIRGIDSAIRGLVASRDGLYKDARDGIEEAAEYLQDKIESKFGVYQSTGGDPKGYGAWKRLKRATLAKKARKYGAGDSPLIASGETARSFSIKMGGKGRLAASVSSSSDVLIHHVYGAPDANVPMRDPARVTAIEEMDACHKIIEKAVLNGIGRNFNG